MGAVERQRKGTVKIEERNGWLSLRWSYGKRYTLALGLADSEINRLVAQGRANQIQTDIATGNFDPSLERYRPQVEAVQGIGIVKLFEEWIAYKARQVEPLTLAKYQTFIGHLQQFFRGRNAASISEDEAFRFRDWLLSKNQPITVRERLGWLRACWKWAIRRKLIKSQNPWDEVRVKVSPRQKQPFSREEIAKILKGFEASEFAHYRDYVEFLLSVGCRPGEANGLRWRHLSPDCSRIWIGESLGREKRQKPTKTNKARFFELSPRLQSMLQARMTTAIKPDDLIFTSVTGQAIDDKNFCKRYWKRVLVSVGVAYRRPYNTRHSFVSHAVDQGVHPGDVSEVTGHSMETLYRDYLGSVRGRVTLPELWQ